VNINWNSLQISWKLVLPGILTAGAVGAAVWKLQPYPAFLWRWRKNWITAKEKELLVEACADIRGCIVVMTKTCGRSPYVKAGGKDYSNLEDPAVCAMYVDAAEKLNIHGCTRSVKSNVYYLTEKGWELGRKFAKKRSKAHG